VTTIAKKTVAKKGKKCNCRKPVQKSSMVGHCQIATRLVFAWCGCDLVKIRVIAKSVTVWLQPLMCCDCKKAVAKTSMCVIATLSHVRDCNLIAVWLQPYRSVIAKNSCKNSITLRLKKPVQKAPCRRKKKSTQKHCRVPNSHIQKKGRKVATSQKKYFQTATNNMSRTIKAKTHGYNMFLSHWS
jgi:hypothetical protein